MDCSVQVAIILEKFPQSLDLAFVFLADAQLEHLDALALRLREAFDGVIVSVHVASYCIWKSLHLLCDLLSERTSLSHPVLERDVPADSEGVHEASGVGREVVLADVLVAVPDPLGTVIVAKT